MKVCNVLKVYEEDGRPIEGLEHPTIEVNSHWNYSDRVVLAIEGKTITVLAHELEKAVKNATNHGKF